MNKPAVYLFAYVTMLIAGLFILRVIVRHGYRDQDRLAPVPATLQALIFFCYGGFPILYLPADWPAVHVNLVQQALGLCLLYGGLGTLLYGMSQLGLLRSLGQGKPAMIQSGLYRFTRNPQVLACGAYVVGFTLMWPSWYAVFWACLFAILIHAMVVTEEEHLRRINGHNYDAYCRKAPRYFGLRSGNSRSANDSQNQLRH